MLAFGSTFFYEEKFYAVFVRFSVKEIRGMSIYLYKICHFTFFALSIRKWFIFILWGMYVYTWRGSILFFITKIINVHEINFVSFQVLCNIHFCMLHEIRKEMGPGRFGGGMGFFTLTILWGAIITLPNLK